MAEPTLAEMIDAQSTAISMAAVAAAINLGDEGAAAYLARLRAIEQLLKRMQDDIGRLDAIAAESLGLTDYGQRKRGFLKELLEADNG